MYIQNLNSYIVTDFLLRLRVVQKLCNSLSFRFLLFILVADASVTELQKFFCQCVIICYPVIMWPRSVGMPCVFMPCALDINSKIRVCGMLLINHQKHHISTTAIPMATKLCRMVTYNEDFSPIKSHDTLKSWSLNITWQVKMIVSPVLPRLWSPNLAGW